MSNGHSAKHRPLISRVGDRLTLSFDDHSVQSEMRLDAPDELVLGYTRTIMAFLLFCPQPSSIAMIGLGGGSLAKYCRATLVDTLITIVEIDPKVIANRNRFFIPEDDEHFQVLCQDGADFVRTTAKRYDILLVDGFNAAGQAPQLGTQRFYSDCCQCLTPRGIMAVNLSDQAHSFDQLIARIRRSFDREVIAIEAEGSANKIVFAGRGNALNLSVSQLYQRLALLERHLPLNLYRTLQAIQAERGAKA